MKITAKQFERMHEKARKKRGATGTRRGETKKAILARLMKKEV